MRISSPWSPAEARREMAAPPELVFSVIADPHTYPDWLLGAERIRSVDPDFPRPGSVFHHSVGPTEESTIDDISEVLAVDPPHRLELRVHVGWLRGIVQLLVAPTATGTEVRFHERPAGRARFAMPVLRPLLHGRNAASLEQLDTLVTGATAGRSATG